MGRHRMGRHGHTFWLYRKPQPKLLLDLAWLGFGSGLGWGLSIKYYKITFSPTCELKSMISKEQIVLLHFIKCVFIHGRWGFPLQIFSCGLWSKKLVPGQNLTKSRDKNVSCVKTLEFKSKCKSPNIWLKTIDLYWKRIQGVVLIYVNLPTTFYARSIC